MIGCLVVKAHTLADIEDFLRQKRIALAGVSRGDQHFSRTMLRELVQRGYEVIPVNPAAEEIEGIACRPSVAAIHPPADAALIMTPPAQSAGVVKDCVAGGVSRIWLHAATKPGSVTEEAVAAGRDAGATVIAGECPFMFLEHTGWVHRAHRFLRGLTGALPK